MTAASAAETQCAAALAAVGRLGRQSLAVRVGPDACRLPFPGKWSGFADRHRHGVTSGDGYGGVAATVPVLLEAGLEVLSDA